MGTLVALYKPFDLAESPNLIKNKYLLYISFFVLTVPFYPGKKKETREQGEKKEKKNQMY